MHTSPGTLPLSVRPGCAHILYGSAFVLVCLVVRDLGVQQINGTLRLLVAYLAVNLRLQDILFRGMQFGLSIPLCNEVFTSTSIVRELWVHHTRG